MIPAITILDFLNIIKITLSTREQVNKLREKIRKKEWVRESKNFVLEDSVKLLFATTGGWAAMKEWKFSSTVGETEMDSKNSGTIICKVYFEVIKMF